VGRSAALALLGGGYKVTLVGRRVEALEETASLAGNNSGNALPISADAGNADSVARVFKETVDSFGRLNVLFNNAGGGASGNFPDESAEDFHRVINVNLNGTFYMSRAVWPHLIEAGGGAVVNMSSLAAQRGASPKMVDKFGSTSSSYWAAKAGVDALTRYMAGVGGRSGIRVNGVRPGQIMTPGATRGTITDPDGGHHAFEKMFDLMQITPGPGYPEDVANLVLFLVSEESRFITGEIINVDGGVAAKL